MPSEEEGARQRLAQRLQPPTAVRLGMVTLAVLAVVGVTGTLLALGYVPDPAKAHDVALDRSEGVLGWTWGVHAWAGSALLAVVLLHAARAWIRGRPDTLVPRRWLSGIAALGAVVGAFFTGTILPWDQQGWEAMKHVQFAGEVLGLKILDVEAPAAAPLDVVFWVHVLAVPLVLATVLAVHLYRRPGARRFAVRVGRLLKTGTRDAAPLLAVVAALAVAFPPLLGPAPFPRLAVTKPDWPFLWLVPVQQRFGSPGLWALPLALSLAGALPTLKTDWTDFQRLALLGVAAVVLVTLTVLGAVA